MKNIQLFWNLYALPSQVACWLQNSNNLKFTTNRIKWSWKFLHLFFYHTSFLFQLLWQNKMKMLRPISLPQNNQSSLIDLIEDTLAFIKLTKTTWRLLLLRLLVRAVLPKSIYFATKYYALPRFMWAIAIYTYTYT